MIHSLIDEKIGEEEFEMIASQDHFEDVWSVMENTVKKYAMDYFDGIAKCSNMATKQQSYETFLKELIVQNDKMNEKYTEIFDMKLMVDEYLDDIDGFKSDVLKVQCDVIRSSLRSKAVAMNVWKSKFKSAKAQDLYDTFYNILSFAQDYNDEMNESIMESIDMIDENKLNEMREDECFQTGVIGYGIVSNILNHMYPRVFPGNYKAGVFALLFLTGKQGRKGINMPSDTSEFCIIKDDVYSKTGTMEEEHNYYYFYGTFGLYSLRIFRLLKDIIKERFGMIFPVDYRFLLTNDFYNYVTVVHKADIENMTGNDDVLKFGTIWGY